MVSLVGHTGFVGSNLKKHGAFDAFYNSKNIGDAFGTCPDILYYSGLPAEKFLADRFPEQDKKRTDEAARNIKRINPKKVVLISTVDVYRTTDNKTESMLTGNESDLPYGAHRLELEKFVSDNFSDFLIVRLPGLFGDNLKKNFIYDFISYIPAMLTSEKMTEIGNIKPQIYDMYKIQENGFYKYIPETEAKAAKSLFREVGFSALNFTDSRAVFQFYNLENLFHDIEIALMHDVKFLNLATEPVSTAEVYRSLTGDLFHNKLEKPVPYYNFKSEHFELFKGKDGYLYSSVKVLEDIHTFIQSRKEC